MGQDNPGVLQDWLGSTNRARAASIAETAYLEHTKKPNLTQRQPFGTAGTKRAHLKGKQRAQFRHKTGTLPAQNGRNFGKN